MSSNHNHSRRSFLMLLPFGVIAGTCATLATAAYRWLRPLPSATSDKWIDIAATSEISGSQPIEKKVMVEHTTGWATSLEKHSVYVLPAKNNQVVSAICPHEGCEVAWRTDAKVFSCPCHDSNFAPDGACLSGPARRGLDPLPSRVQDGKFQVQYRLPASNFDGGKTRG